MVKIKSLSLILLAFLFLVMNAPKAFADNDEVPELSTVNFSGDLFGRSSANFGKKSNIDSVVPQGSQGEILEVRRMPSGSYGVHVKITKVGGDRGGQTVKEGDQAWVYYSQKNPYLNFPDKDGVDIQDPEQSLVQKVNEENGISLISANPKALVVPDKADILKAEPADDPNLPINPDTTKTEAQPPCPTCGFKPQASPATNNQNDLAAISTKVMPPPKAVPPDPNNKWATDPIVSAYSNRASTNAMIRYLNKHKLSHSSEACYRFVKRAMVATDVIKHYPPGGYARDGVRDLKNQGMINMLDNPRYRAMIKSPKDAPKGAILVYANGVAAGDITVKTENGDKGTYVNDFSSPHTFLTMPRAVDGARDGHPYKLIGVMIKP